MSHTDLTAIMPLIILAVTTALLVIQMSLKRSHLFALTLSLIGLAGALVSLIHISPLLPHRVGSLMIVDNYAQLFSGIIIMITAVVCIMTHSYLSRREEHRDEMYALIILAAIGSIVLTGADHFVTLILGLETLTIALYVMIGYLREDFGSLEAGIKYLVLAAASSAFLLFGMGLIYAELGTMEFQVLAEILTSPADYRELFVLVGTALVIVGAGFKLGVVPFHMWTPDVYEGAPAPVTAFIATVSKTAMVALLLRYVVVLDLNAAGSIMTILAVIAIASMLLGNLLALLQSNLKRLLAYSSIAHLGYLLVAVIAGGQIASEATVFYMLVYSFTTLGAFGLIAYVSGGNHETMSIDEYRGLFWKHPMASLVLSVMLLSLAGIPLTAGFIGKFFLIGAGVAATQWTLVIVLVVTSAVGLYYYLRVIATMVGKDDPDSKGSSVRSLSFAGTTILTIITVIVIYLGVRPDSILALIRSMLKGFI